MVKNPMEIVRLALGEEWELEERTPVSDQLRLLAEALLLDTSPEAFLVCRHKKRESDWAALMIPDALSPAHIRAYMGGDFSHPTDKTAVVGLLRQLLEGRPGESNIDSRRWALRRTPSVSFPRLEAFLRELGKPVPTHLTDLHFTIPEPDLLEGLPGVIDRIKRMDRGVFCRAIALSGAINALPECSTKPIHLAIAWTPVAVAGKGCREAVYLKMYPPETQAERMLAMVLRPENGAGRIPFSAPVSINESHIYYPPDDPAPLFETIRSTLQERQVRSQPQSPGAQRQSWGERLRSLFGRGQEPRPQPGGR